MASEGNKIQRKKSSWIATFLIGVAWHFFCTLLESVDWSVVSRPRPSANYSIVAMVPKRWSIACKAANESIISFQWIHNGVNCIGRCKRQEQSRHSPLHRMVPTGIASWLTWRRTRWHKELAIVALGFSPNQQFKLFKSRNWQDLCPGTESLYAWSRTSWLF